MDDTVKKVLAVFKSKFPKLTPQYVYKVPTGYLVIAPAFTDEVDYGDPNYFVNEDCTEVSYFNMMKIQWILNAFDKGPLWKRGD